jgi:hypothetical protein
MLGIAPRGTVRRNVGVTALIKGHCISLDELCGCSSGTSLVNRVYTLFDLPACGSSSVPSLSEANVH